MSDRRTIRYLGGPLDGLELGAWETSDEDLAEGAYQIVHGWAEERAEYGPDKGADPLVWHYRGPVLD